MVERGIDYPEVVCGLSAHAVELNRGGLVRLFWDLLRSHGNALILVHPTFQKKHSALQKRLDFSMSPTQQAQAAVLVHELNAFSEEVVRLMTAAGKAQLPVIAFFELQKDTYLAGLKDRKKQALEVALSTLHRYGYRGGQRLYYVITETETPVSIDDANKYIEREDAENAVAHRLQKAGLRYAVVGGAYFGGMGFSSTYQLRFDKRQTPLSRWVQRELIPKRDPGSPFKHPLEFLGVDGCVSGVLYSLADAGGAVSCGPAGHVPRAHAKSIRDNV